MEGVAAGRHVLEIVGVLASETDVEAAARILLERLLEVTGAQRGFIVVREADSYVDVFNVAFDRSAVSTEERRFSRRLVRMAAASREPLYSASAATDPRFASVDSVASLGPRAVLVVPLCEREVVHGIVYFDSPVPIDEPARGWVIELARLTAPLLRRAVAEEALRRRARALESDLLAQFDFEGIVTRDPQVLALLRIAAQVADATATVLIRGETGTGKELLARALHVNSSRRERPFVALHCAALPDTVLEAELFGHVRSAFTGADRDRAGRIASARGGTLFIDEVGEIPLGVQVKLLRFLQSGEIQRLGSDRPEQVEVRVVCATNRDLAALVKEGRFREDLYYRIQVIELVLPPLRERSGDRELLVEHFLARFARQKGMALRLTAEARAALVTYHYPGNARELEHAIERMALLATTPELGVELLPPAIRPGGPASTSFRDYTSDELRAARAAAVAEVEARFVEGLLQKSDGNVSAAARLAGMPRGYLQKLIARRRGR
ncbi:MAG TPA: sigma 54-interacting transcriptional regulator [Kofleriaceae bacterium]